MRPTSVIVGAALIAAAVSPLSAQRTAAPLGPMTWVRVYGADANRAALGITTASTGKRDTLGLLIESVTSGSPADQAGLEEGDRIASINGENLKVAPGDAGEPEMAGLMTRRLIRALGKVKPGDDVTLQIYAGGALKTTHVKTTALDQIGGGRTWVSADDAANRSAIGLGLDGGGGRRDTLGLLVTSVATGGPADRAGIEEGDRIARIDSVDLRVPASEAAGGALVGAKERRFVRELQRSRPGDVVTLEVWADGAMKTVKVTTVRAEDVYPDRMRRGFGFGFGDGRTFSIPPVAPMPPMPPMPNVELLEQRANDLVLPEVLHQLDDVKRVDVGASREAMRSARQALRQAQQALEHVRVALSWRASDGGPDDVGSLQGIGDGMISLGGLRLAPVSADLSSYFGKGSENGLLVLDASARWAPLRAGDVILEVNGTPVKDGDRTSLSFGADRDTSFLLLRKGARVTVVVKGR